MKHLLVHYLLTENNLKKTRFSLSCKSKCTPICEVMLPIRAMPDSAYQLVAVAGFNQADES